jgi:hypothetical protein
VHELKPKDPPSRTWFCNWMLQNVYKGHVDPWLLFMTGEAFFHLGVYVNSQNNWIWSDKNLHVFHHFLLHDKYLSVMRCRRYTNKQSSIFVENHKFRSICPEPFFLNS